jgi:hypothetical protein
MSREFRERLRLLRESENGGRSAYAIATDILKNTALFLGGMMARDDWAQAQKALWDEADAAGIPRATMVALLEWHE